MDIVQLYFPLCLVTLLVLLLFEVVDPAPFLIFLSGLGPLTLGLESDSNMASEDV